MAYRFLSSHQFPYHIHYRDFREHHNLLHYSYSRGSSR